MKEVQKIKPGDIIITKDKIWIFQGCPFQTTMFFRVTDLINGVSCIKNSKHIKTLSSQILEKHCT